MSSTTDPLVPEMFKYTNTCTMNMFKIWQVMQSSLILLLFSFVGSMLDLGSSAY